MATKHMVTMAPAESLHLELNISSKYTLAALFKKNVKGFKSRRQSNFKTSFLDEWLARLYFKPHSHFSDKIVMFMWGYSLTI